MAEQQEQRERHAAHNQALFRSVNERLRELNESLPEVTSYSSWICECFRTDCAEMVEMTLGEYEQLRAHPEHFAVLADPSHVDARGEEVVSRGERYWMVAKIGSAAAVARELDERTP
jgi:hypothetical protein